MVKRLPGSLLQSLEGVAGFHKDAFVAVHEEGTGPTSIRVNRAKWKEGSPFPDAEPVPWSRTGFYLHERPSFTFDPLFHAGCYYVQEASSMFLEQALLQCADLSADIKVLDLCAAPGGKSTHIQSLISAGSLLVSNEVIRTRTPVLVDNIVKWGSANVLVSSNDPATFGRLPGYFDVMVVDAPCSGSGLFRRDPGAIDEWSLNNVQLCAQRQQRILADALPTLKEGGLLVYSTCSYSREEDEEILQWLVREMDLEGLSLNTDPEWNIVASQTDGATGYRFYPDQLKGEGLFMACLRKKGGEKEARIKPSKPERANAKERLALEPWLAEADVELVRDRNNWIALPSHLLTFYQELKTTLYLSYSGVGLGAIMKEKLVPQHSLALSTLLSPDVPFVEVSEEEAVRYLQRNDLNFNTSGKGWQTVRYKGHNLGWINVLPNRINNYYPKEIRILKGSNPRNFEK